MKLKAIVELRLPMGNDENFEEASDRLYDLLIEKLYCGENCDFWIESVEETD